MHPYRTSSQVSIFLGPRWGVTSWSKLYVTVVRKFYNLRSKYRFRREYNQYTRDLACWKAKYGPRENDKLTYEMAKAALKRPPMPCPPPIYISE